MKPLQRIKQLGVHVPSETDFFFCGFCPDSLCFMCSGSEVSVSCFMAEICKHEHMKLIQINNIVTNTLYIVRMIVIAE